MAGRHDGDIRARAQRSEHAHRPAPREAPPLESAAPLTQDSSGIPDDELYALLLIGGIVFGFVLVVAALLLLMRRRDRHHQQLGEELLRLARNQSEMRKAEGAASYQNLGAAVAGIAVLEKQDPNSAVAAAQPPPPLSESGGTPSS